MSEDFSPFCSSLFSVHPLMKPSGRLVATAPVAPATPVAPGVVGGRGSSSGLSRRGGGGSSRGGPGRGHQSGHGRRGGGSNGGAGGRRDAVDGDVLGGFCAGERRDGGDAGEVAGREGGDGDGDGEAEAVVEVVGHRVGLVAGGRGGQRGGGGRVAAAGAARLQAGALAVAGLAAVEDAVARLGPHGEVGDGDVGAGGAVGAGDLDGAALGAVGAGALPVVEGDVGEGDAVTALLGHGGPVLVDVERVGVRLADEVLEDDVGHGAAAAVGLDHHHLVGLVGVDVTVLDVRDIRVLSQRAESTAARPVAVDVLDQDVVGGRLDGNALVLVGDHDIVDPDVVTPDVNAVETTVVTAADGQVVELAVLAGVKGEVEGGRVSQSQVVDGEVGDIVETQDTGARDGAVLVELVAVALEGTGTSAGEDLNIAGVLNEDHVATIGTGAVDDTVHLEGPGGTAVQLDPGVDGIVTLGNDNETASLAVGVSRGKSRANISGLVSLGTVVGDIASLGGLLVRGRSERTDSAGELARNQCGHDSESRNESGGKGRHGERGSATPKKKDWQKRKEGEEDDGGQGETRNKRTYRLLCTLGATGIGETSNMAKPPDGVTRAWTRHPGGCRERAETGLGQTGGATQDRWRSGGRGAARVCVRAAGPEQPPVPDHLGGD